MIVCEYCGSMIYENVALCPHCLGQITPPDKPVETAFSGQGDHEVVLVDLGSCGSVVCNNMLEEYLGYSDEDGDKLILPAADSTTKFVCKEITDIYGELGYRFVVDKLNKRYYFVENGMDDFNDGGEYDNREYVTKVGDLLRAHPLQVGEEFIISGAANAYTVGTSYGVLATGVVG